MFDIAAASELLAPTPLHDITGPQSLAFDDVHGHIYTLQVMQGGLRLPGERHALRASARRLNGDMCVTKLSASGATLGHMYLRGFGHGISFGVEPSGKKVLLWVEADAHPRTGYGRAVTRVRFRDGAVVDSSAPSVRHHRPLPGSKANHPALDLAGRRVLISHRAGKYHRYAVYRMSDFLGGHYAPVHTVRSSGLGKGERFQGCALLGGFVYQLTGHPYSDAAGDNPPGAGGNTYVSAIDLRTGEAAGRHRVTAAPGLPFREPEGIAVHRSGETELCVALSVEAPGRRHLTAYSMTQYAK